MNLSYQQDGYCLLPSFLTEAEVTDLALVVEHFHQSWLEDNHDSYLNKAVNSAYLTGSKYLTDEQRLVLFDIVASHKVAQALKTLSFDTPAFMNSQLFFDPANLAQNNYWHRDCQYHLDLAQQQAALEGPEVLHFRLALTDEAGIELIPKSHKLWDTPEQLKVRTEQGGAMHFDPLEGSKTIALKRGDLLIFSANMIHRGLYSKGRRAFDIVFCESTQAMMAFVEPGCLPSDIMIKELENAAVFTEPKRYFSQDEHR